MKLRVLSGSVTREDRRSTLLSAIFAASALLAATFSGAAHAEEFKFGDLSISTATTLKAGVTMRASARDCRHVSLVNGGCAQGDGAATGANSDNGNLNFGPGDITSATVRATMDIAGKWKNYGFFVRPTAFYDQVYAANNMDFYDLTPTAQGVANGEAKILDAYVYGSFDIAGHQTTIRFGKQVLNWGESLFIQGGVNAFQAADVTAIRAPGSELREGYTAMPMLVFQTALTPDISLEAFWQFAYSITRLDPAGSFFSSDDISGPGSLPAISNPNFDDPQTCAPDGSYNPADYMNPAVNPICLSRTADRGQDSTNQFGLALHYYAADVGMGTDFGLYFVRYSSRLPYLGFTNGPTDFQTTCDALAGTPGACTNSAVAAAYAPLAFAIGANQSTYFYDFPTIQTIGASFNTTVGVTAVAGELTYSPKMPFGINDNATNASQIDGLGATDALANNKGLPTGPISVLPYNPGPGQSTLTHIDLDAFQGQLNTIDAYSSTDLIPSVLGADSGYFLFNVGFVYVPNADRYPLNRSGFEGGYLNATGAALLAGSATATNPQYATDWSTGYVMRLGVDYNNAFNTAFTVSPYLAWRQDLAGWSPGPNTANYVQGLKQVGIGVGIDYQSTWKANLAYVNTFSNDWTVQMTDRDYVQASISYAF